MQGEWASAARTIFNDSLAPGFAKVAEGSRAQIWQKTRDMIKFWRKFQNIFTRPDEISPDSVWRTVLLVSERPWYMYVAAENWTGDIPLSKGGILLHYLGVKFLKTGSSLGVSFCNRANKSTDESLQFAADFVKVLYSLPVTFSWSTAYVLGVFWADEICTQIFSGESIHVIILHRGRLNGTWTPNPDLKDDI